MHCIKTFLGGIFSRLHRHVLEEATNLGTVCGLRLYVEKENRQAQRTYQRPGQASPASWAARSRKPLRSVPARSASVVSFARSAFMFLS